ncbi:sugar transferase [Streptomyces lichenis]|uniref:Sugar transferase n=1 Tax=Streptomyces lichenis TaxID=2306967 RepID=A0ABT0IFH3_9ACTN|nr:sugar transferase [Streptomyces lichenis]MCK8680065.1 sugar transferase [Streptomyces lichenis]
MGKPSMAAPPPPPPVPLTAAAPAATRPPDPKRLLDAALATLLLALLAPLLAAAALAVAARRPPGGTLVREPRIGLGGAPLTLRSLPVRRFRLDALSRLPHVVRGELALVGPAPLPPGDPAAHLPWRHSVRPGLTGPAQLARGSELPWDEPLLLDQHYVEHHWLGMDLALLARRLLRRSSPCVRGQAHLSDADHRVPGYSPAS